MKNPESMKDSFTPEQRAQIQSLGLTMPQQKKMLKRGARGLAIGSPEIASLHEILK